MTPSYQNIFNNLDRGNMVERNGKQYLFLHGWKWQTSSHICEAEVLVPDDIKFTVNEFTEFKPVYMFKLTDKSKAEELIRDRGGGK